MKTKSILLISGITIFVLIIILVLVISPDDSKTGEVKLNLKPERSPLISLLSKTTQIFSAPEEIKEDNLPGLRTGDVLRKQRSAVESLKNMSSVIPSYVNFVTTNETISFKRIPIGKYLSDSTSNVLGGLTEREWPLLRSYSINGVQGNTEVRQYLRFRTGSNDSIETGLLTFSENEQGETGDYFYSLSGSDLFEYEIKFLSGFKSILQNVSNSTIRLLPDFNREDFEILGRKYKILNVQVSGTEIKFDLIGGFKEFGDFILEEGQENIFQLDFVNYTVEIENIANDDTVILSVENETADIRGEGKAHQFDNGVVVGMQEIIQNEAEEVVGGDLVRVSIGRNETGRRIIRDSDYRDDVYFNSGMTVNGNDLPGVRIKIIGHISDNDNYFIMDSMQYRLISDASGGSIYLGSGKRLRDIIREPQALLFDFYYAGTTSNYRGLGSTTAGSGASGNQSDYLDNLFDIYSLDKDEYRLAFKNTNGEIFDFVFYNSNQQFSDKDGKEFVFNESRNSTEFKIEEEDSMILTDANDRNGFSEVYRYDQYDATNGRLSFLKLSDYSTNYVSLRNYYPPICGDANLDRNLSVQDEDLILKVVAGTSSFPLTLNRECVDVDDDGDIDATDGLYVNQSGAILNCSDPCVPTGSIYSNLLSGDLVTGGTTHRMILNNRSATRPGRNKPGLGNGFAIDLNGDGDFANDIMEAVTYTGARINFSNSSPIIKLIRQANQFISRSNDSIINLSIQKDTNGLYISVPSDSEISMDDTSGTTVTIGGTTFAVTPGDRIGQSIYGDIIYERERSGDNPNDLSVLQFVSDSSSSGGGSGGQSRGRMKQTAGEIVLS